MYMFNHYLTIASPLDQFEIRNLFSIDTPLLANMNISITNIGLYMTIAAFIAFYFSVLATNHSKITPNSWSLSQETLYATIHSIVVNQINNKSGQAYFPFMYALFIFILINNLIGMVKRSLHKNIIHKFSLTN
jgi:F-type H+-transporting ATPase subunit a